MVIVHVLAGLPLGGAETLVLNLSRFQKQLGHEVIVFNIDEATTLVPTFMEAGVSVKNIRLTPVASWWFPYSLVKRLKHVKADIVHAHNAAWRKSVAACSFASAPCVWTLHGYHRNWLRRERRWIDHAVRRTQFLVGVESGVAELLRHELCLDEYKVACIPNGVPDSVNAPIALDVASLLPHDAHVIGMATRMEYPKDFETLLHAFALICAQKPQTHLLLIGDGSMRQRIMNLAQALEVYEKVTFAGFRKDVASCMKLMDVFVHSSLTESISVAILEAMSVERAIVATAVGGTPFVLDGGRCGLLVPPGDAQAMAEAILELLTNREKAQQLARNARQRFLEHFTIDATGKRYLEVYQQAIDDFRQRRVAR